MKSIKYIAVIALALTAFCVSGRANLIDLGIRNLPSILGNPDAEKAFVESDQGLGAGSLTYLNKFEDNGTWDNGAGAVDSSHFTVTLIDGGVNALVSWDLTGTGFQLSYLLVKDGRDGGHGPFLYHLYGVTADQVLIGSGEVTVNGLKGISHITFFGVAGGGRVPEGGATFILLGLALIGTELLRRTVSRRAV